MSNFIKELKNIKVKTEETYLESWISNWSYLNISLTTSRDIDARTLLVLMHYEVLTKNRFQMLTRLKSKYNTLRSQQELKDLKEYHLTQIGG